MTVGESRFDPPYRYSGNFLQFTVYTLPPPIPVYWEILTVYSIHPTAPHTGILENPYSIQYTPYRPPYRYTGSLENLYSIQYTGKSLQYTVYWKSLTVYSIVKNFRACGAVYSMVFFSRLRRGIHYGIFFRLRRGIQYSEKKFTPAARYTV